MVGVATTVTGPVAVDSLAKKKGRSSKSGIQLPNSRVKYAAVFLLETSVLSVERSRAWLGFTMRWGFI